MKNRIYTDDDIFPAFEEMLNNPERFKFEPCGEEYPELFCCAQTHNKKIFITYCFKEGNKGKAMAVFTSNKMIKDVCFFNLVYAVAPQLRGGKLGTKMVRQALTQFVFDMKHAVFEPKLTHVGVETCVGIHNLVSQKISRKFISISPKIIRDSLTGKPQYEYHRVFTL